MLVLLVLLLYVDLGADAGGVAVALDVELVAAVDVVVIVEGEVEVGGEFRVHAHVAVDDVVYVPTDV